MDPNKELIKKLRIKSGSVKRTKKEYENYLKEETEQREKVAKMREEEKDASDIKQQTAVLNDTLQVIPDARERLGKFAGDLQSFMEESVPKDLDLSKSGDFEKLVTEAQELLKESAAHLPA